MNQYSRTVFRTSVAGAIGVPIDEAGSDVAERVKQGKAALKIVETPWGVEFYVLDSEEPQ